mgnify:CR=1 FL=1
MPSDRLILGLREGRDGRRLGGKAQALADLLRAGFPVPPACVVTTDALDRHIADAGLAPLCEAVARAAASGDGDRARAAAQAAAAAIEVAPLSAALEAELGPAWSELAEAPLRPGAAPEEPALFVVRSSAPGEDGAERSYAGQFETVINVAGLGRIRDAIRTVWASWYSDRAMDYRLRSGVPVPALPAMAVLLQRLVPPRASGMLFTAHPVTGCRTEMVLEAGPGLGEALASGRVLPDFFVLERRDGGTLRIAERGVATKQWRLMPLPPGSGRLEFRPLPAKEQKKPCLDDAELRRIAQLGLDVEERLGGPVDLEWTLDPKGRLHLLQARPVTALAEDARPLPTAQELRARPVLWTQRFSGERWTQQATPLGWSVIQPVLHHFIEWERASEGWLEGSAPTRLYRGRPYFNVSIFRHLVFRMPGGSPPQFVLEFFPPGEQDELRRGAPRLPNLGLVASIFGQVLSEKRWQRYRFNLLTNHTEWERFRPGFEGRIQALSLDFDSVDEGLVEVDRAQQLMLEYMSIHLLSLLFAHLFYEALDKALASWVGLEGEAIRSALVADPEENRTLLTNKALWKLAREAGRHPAVAERLQQGALGVDELERLEGGPAFRQALDAFLAEFGHRSAASYEIFATRWADSPDMVLGLVAAVLRGGDTPAAVETRRAEERAHAQELVRQRMRRTLRRRVAPWRPGVFAWLLEHTRRYMALRENQRFVFDRLLLRTKRIFERTGALLERDGRLAAGEDLVFLELEELRGLASGALEPGTAAARIRDRRDEFDRNVELSHPDFLEGQEGEALPGEEGTPRWLVGQPISPGTVRGTVRILRSLDDAGKLQPGDILVARATDPGWTPLFLTAKGLILELGSVLSHGAVVAREYGLPAVVNVDGATRRLKDGMIVTVDGDRGRVVVHRAEMIPDRSARDVREEGVDA